MFENGPGENHGLFLEPINPLGLAKPWGQGILTSRTCGLHDIGLAASAMGMPFEIKWLPDKVVSSITIAGSNGGVVPHTKVNQITTMKLFVLYDGLMARAQAMIIFNVINPHLNERYKKNWKIYI